MKKCNVCITRFICNCTCWWANTIDIFLFKFSVALHPQRPSGLLGTGSPGRPLRLSHSSWALRSLFGFLVLTLLERHKINMRYSCFPCQRKTQQPCYHVIYLHIHRSSNSHINIIVGQTESICCHSTPIPTPRTFFLFFFSFFTLSTITSTNLSAMMFSYYAISFL